MESMAQRLHPNPTTDCKGVALRIGDGASVMLSFILS
jgi:hypothetical protein